MTEWKTLKQLRLARGYTQEQVAELVGFTKQAGYSRLETGVNSTTVDKIVRLAEVLQVTPGVIIDLLVSSRN